MYEEIGGMLSTVSFLVEDDLLNIQDEHISHILIIHSSELLGTAASPS